MNLPVFSEHFSNIEDPRKSAKTTYLLNDVLFFILCAVIACCHGIEDFCVDWQLWSAQICFFALSVRYMLQLNGLSHRIERTQLHLNFDKWMQEVSVPSERLVMDRRITPVSFW